MSGQRARSARRYHHRIASLAVLTVLCAYLTACGASPSSHVGSDLGTLPDVEVGSIYHATQHGDDQTFIEAGVTATIAGAPTAATVLALLDDDGEPLWLWLCVGVGVLPVVCVDVTDGEIAWGAAPVDW